MIHFEGQKHRRRTWLFAVASVGPCLWAAQVLAIPEVPTAAGQPVVAPGRVQQLLGLWKGSASDLTGYSLPWDIAPPAPQMHLGQAPPQPSADTQISQAPATEAEDSSGDILDEVSVTATRRPTRERDTTATTYTVTKEDFRRLGALTVTDALVQVPGFQSLPALGGVRNSGNSYLRGFDDQRFQLLRDGISLQRSSNNRVDISRISLEDIERVEVVTGGATLRYGAGAAGGVINLISETPKGPPKLTLKYEAGSYGFSRYVGKYGGGDDTFSYNLVYTGLVAFNNFPYSLTVPNTAQFYDRDAVAPNGQSLFGYLKPELGPAVTLSGINDTGYNASDSYSGKLVFRPDPANRLTLRLNQQNSKNEAFGPGRSAFGLCRGGTSVQPNGTTSGRRFLPLDANGNELPCDTQAFIFNTPTAAFSSRYNFDANAAGTVAIPTGQSYLIEPLTGTTNFFQRFLQAQTEATVFWDYDITPTTSLNSYLSLVRLLTITEQPSPFFYDTNAPGTGTPGALTVPPPAQPFIDNQRYEAQIALNSQISPGQNLSFGINFLEDRSYQQQQSKGAQTFFDRAISRLSLFLIDDVSFSNELKANLGLRLTSSSQFGSVLTPAAGVRYSPNNVLSLRANYSYIFNAPALSNLFATGSNILANPGLRPESGVTYDVGFDLTPARNLGLRFTYFNSYLDGAIGGVTLANPNPAAATAIPLVVQAQNLDTRQASGIEAVADWRPIEPLRLQAIWTNSDVRAAGNVDNPSQSTFPFYYQFQDPGIPFNSVLLSASYVHRGWLVALVGRYDGGKRRATTASGVVSRGSNEYVPAWATLDLNVEIPLAPLFTLTGSVFNLTDTQYESLSGIPAPGTTFRIGGRLELGG
ncbi:MAG: TonB-dependent receptor [Aphanocapsa lilacina HA4352-LM1]|jgi:iron complex outermembrane receptor protein|nr:TonB-dependent receptor [Aphanocapsa lilacina HA4352-LM1]